MGRGRHRPSSASGPTREVHPLAIAEARSQNEKDQNGSIQYRLYSTTFQFDGGEWQSVKRRPGGPSLKNAPTLEYAVVQSKYSDRQIKW